MLSKLRKVSLLLIVMVLATTAFIMPAEAKTINLKNQGYTPRITKASSSASTIHLGKQTLRVGKKGNGYASFVAPVSGKYTITISKMKKHKHNHLAYAYCCLQTPSQVANTLMFLDAKTYGGKHYILYFNTKNINKGSKIYRYRKKRTGQVTLKAGQQVYMFFHCKKKDRFNVTISKI